MNKKIVIATTTVANIALLSQFTYLLPLHLAAFIASAAAVVIADVHALLWVVGRKTMLPAGRLIYFHNVVSWGLLISVVSGVLLFWPVRDYLLYIPSFYVKLCFVVTLIINGVVIHQHMHVAFERSFASLSSAERRPLLISGAISTVSWVGAFVAAQYLGL